MKLRDMSFQYIKDLYFVKVKAMERNDKNALENLKEQYPELFDTTFLLDILVRIFHGDMNTQENQIH